MFKQYHFCNVFNTIYQIWLTKIYEHMYQHQNILFYHWSATINIHEQRLFRNLEDIYFAYYMYIILMLIDLQKMEILILIFTFRVIIQQELVLTFYKYNYCG